MLFFGQFFGTLLLILKLHFVGMQQQWAIPSIKPVPRLKVHPLVHPWTRRNPPVSAVVAPPKWYPSPFSGSPPLFHSRKATHTQWRICWIHWRSGTCRSDGKRRDPWHTCRSATRDAVQCPTANALLPDASPTPVQRCNPRLARESGLDVPWKSTSKSWAAAFFYCRNDPSIDWLIDWSGRNYNSKFQSFLIDKSSVFQSRK